MQLYIRLKENRDLILQFLCEKIYIHINIYKFIQLLYINQQIQCYVDNFLDQFVLQYILINKQQSLKILKFNLKLKENLNQFRFLLHQLNNNQFVNLFKRFVNNFINKNLLNKIIYAFFFQQCQTLFNIFPQFYHIKQLQIYIYIYIYIYTYTYIFIQIFYNLIIKFQIQLQILKTTYSYQLFYFQNYLLQQYINQFQNVLIVLFYLFINKIKILLKLQKKNIKKISKLYTQIQKMADVFLIIISIVIAILLTFTSFYLLILYCHPDDRGWGTSLFCKIIVIIGCTLSWAQVLILPLDVSNSRGNGNDLNMEVFWQIIYMIIGIMVSIVIPFAQLMYETDDEKPFLSRLLSALFMEICYFIVISIAYFISWAYLKFADIPIEYITNTSSNPFVPSDQLVVQSAVSKLMNYNNISITYEVSFIIYVMAFTSFIGNFLFVLFGGVGLFALPIDLIQEFINKPKLRSSKEAYEIKEILKQKTKKLIEQGIEVKRQLSETSVADGYWQKRKENNKLKKMQNQFRVNVLSLERDYQIFKLELNIVGINPAIWFFKLIGGVIFFIVSIIWWLHIILYVLSSDINGFPKAPFLNEMLIELESSGVSFLSTALFAFLSLYLLWCVQKGNIKFGLRIPFIFTLHPMKVNETWMNSFLFNINLVLICSVAVCQFCAKAFSQYARLTAIDNIFNTQVKNLRFFKYFYNDNVFEYAIVVWSVLTCLYLIIRTSDKPKQLQEIEELRKQKIK
ncbi:lmbr1-like conserved region family protein, putative [Ichthyophthirius multifiliis]|uniref:Lmbr1-like conserved region family protein, putative n=1 Tax=Ichthyophthirius multifiliis TaxID=5932 RepID=G0QVG7_ICHMU|nr:lmbr1-like conserved region family protein, putative [Ichthyophthirius multifiliis]EGR30777.1 lmbr1-like conserved region family protein, putative [Ichthyophthirius multifiliis]|eukprot:XP_004032364.1 lmbr1-like conserved region family protein, putative [Ichthyophthirius multifiliis]